MLSSVQNLSSHAGPRTSAIEISPDGRLLITATKDELPDIAQAREALLSFLSRAGVDGRIKGKVVNHSEVDKEGKGTAGVKSFVRYELYVKHGKGNLVARVLRRAQRRHSRMVAAQALNFAFQRAGLGSCLSQKAKMLLQSAEGSTSGLRDEQLSRQHDGKKFNHDIKAWDLKSQGDKLTLHGTAVTLGSKLGEGAYGTVFSADCGGQRLVAKETELTGAADESPQARLDRAYHGALVHGSLPYSPHVIGYRGVIRTADSVTCLMERADCDLDEFCPLIAKAVDAGRITEEESKLLQWAILKQILLGVQHMHQNGYTHYDIKPKNILLLLNEGRVALADFETAGGMARSISARLTATVEWTAPEILEIEDQNTNDGFTYRKKITNFQMQATTLFERSNAAKKPATPATDLETTETSATGPEPPKKHPWKIKPTLLPLKKRKKLHRTMVNQREKLVQKQAEIYARPVPRGPEVDVWAVGVVAHQIFRGGSLPDGFESKQGEFFKRAAILKIGKSDRVDANTVADAETRFILSAMSPAENRKTTFTLLTMIPSCVDDSKTISDIMKRVKGAAASTMRLGDEHDSSEDSGRVQFDNGL